jgi:peptide/nickel transport system permease protein
MLRPVRRFLVRRVISSAITLIVFATFVFFLASALMPGDFTNNFMPGLGSQREVLREQLGLDRSLWGQWIRFMTSFLKGEFGISNTGRPIIEIMMILLPWTMLIFTLSITLAFLFGHWLGRMIGWSRSRLVKGVVRFAAVTAHTAFPPILTFVLAVIFVRVFSDQTWAALQRVEDVDAGGFRLGRTAISVPEGQEGLLWAMILGIVVIGVLAMLVGWAYRRLLRRRLPGFVLLGLWVGGNLWFWSLLGERTKALDILTLLFLPMLAVGILAFGEIALVVESAMDGVRGEQYILAARAKGLRERDVRDHHAARVALLPALSKFVVSLPFVLTGLVIVEFAFTVPSHYGVSLYFPGLSIVLFRALEARDFPLVMGGLLFIGMISIGARIVIDVLHAALDPRIRYGIETESKVAL